MSCLICNGVDDTNQGICPRCIACIRNNPSLMNAIKVVVPTIPLSTAVAIAKCIDALQVQLARGSEDPESSGALANRALCEFITDLGYPVISELYQRVDHY